jgi:hypothetical protein
LHTHSWWAHHAEANSYHIRSKQAVLLIARDIILVLCAVISAACLLYIAMNLNTASEEDTGVDETPRTSLEEPRNRS